MTRWSLFILMCFVCCAARGQVTVNNENGFVISSAPMRPQIGITVVDAETKRPLEKAVVKLAMAKGDTVNLVCDMYGRVRYDKRIPKDSLVFTVSHIGYANLRWVHKMAGAVTSLTIELQADPIQIGSIIVQGENIAMVIRGDTTVYNAAAFKTMRGDPLAELIKKLPGVEFRGGEIYAQGQRVSRILVDGTPMFAQFTDRAIELVKANNVDEIKVYDQHSDKDIALGDTLKPKERVLDVKTRNKMNLVQRVHLTGVLGVYADRNPSGKYEELYSATGQYDRHRVGDNLGAGLGYGEKFSWGQPTGNFDNELGGSLKWDKNIKNYKYHLQSFSTYNDSRSTASSGSHTDYFPAGDYLSRSQTTDLRSDSRVSNFSTLNSLSFKIRKKHNILLSLNLANKVNSLNSTNYSDLVLNDAAAYLSNTNVYDRKDNMTASGGVKYSYNFKKPSRKVSSEISYAYRDGWGEGWSVDTLASSTQNIYLTNSNGSRNKTYTGKASYTEPLSKKSNLTLLYDIEQRNDRSTLLGIDRITGAPDMQNTHDYTQDYLRNRYSASYMYRNSHTHFTVSLAAQSIKQNRDEASPESANDSRTYFNLVPRFILLYNKSATTVSVTYTESVLPPSVEQQRNALDTYNAPLYTAGNPSLKEMVDRSLNIIANTINAKNYNAWSFSLTANLYQNSHVAKEYFFTAPTQRSEFGNFTFPAGSTLQTVQNAAGRLSLETTAGFSAKSGFLNSTVNAALRYAYDKTPYYVYEVLNMNDMHTCNLSLGLVSDFSKKIEISFSADTGVRYYEKDENTAFKEINETVRGKVRFNFAKRLWISADGCFRFRDTSLPNTVLREIVLNSEFACKFGKEDKGSLSINFNDILNQARSWRVFMENDYVKTERIAILGRNAYLKLSYSF